MATTDVPQGGQGNVEVDWTFNPTLNPLVFNPVIPGNSDTQTSNLAVGASNLQVTDLTVTPTGGSVFSEANVLFSLNNVDFYSVSTFPYSILVNTGSPIDLYVKFTPPIGTPSGDHDGTITYTIFEQTT